MGKANAGRGTEWGARARTPCSKGFYSPVKVTRWGSWLFKPVWEKASLSLLLKEFELVHGPEACLLRAWGSGCTEVWVFRWEWGRESSWSFPSHDQDSKGAGRAAWIPPSEMGRESVSRRNCQWCLRAGSPSVRTNSWKGTVGQVQSKGRLAFRASPAPEGDGEASSTRQATCCAGYGPLPQGPLYPSTPCSPPMGLQELAVSLNWRSQPLLCSPLPPGPSPSPRPSHLATGMALPHYQPPNPKPMVYHILCPSFYQ